MFNEKILNYCFPGIPTGKHRETLVTLKNTLIGSGISVGFSLDSEKSPYAIIKTKDGYAITMGETPIQLTPEQYLYEFLGKQVDLNWYKNLKVGDRIKIGFCDGNPSFYHFRFDTNRIRANKGNEFTIKTILKSRISGCPKWSNGDPNGYLLAELGHYVPSSVFIPQFVPSKPIEIINLMDIDSKILQILM